MITKDPVALNDSLIEVEGEELDYETVTFWSDTFRKADLLRYQDGDVKMMLSENDETTTFELTLETDDVPEVLEQFWETGERFHINIENEHFDLNVDTAWVADVDEGTVTIVAKVLRRGFAHVA